MIRTLLPILFVLAPAVASAAESSPPPKDPAVVAAPPPSSAKPSTVRAISSQVADLLAAHAPKYTPPEPAPAKSPETELPPVDQPRNGIIRLSPYVVRERRPPELKERDLLTAKGKLDLALRRHPGLRLGAFGPLNNHAWAGAMIEEELALERRQEMLDLLSLLPGKPGQQSVPYWRPWFTTLRPSSGPYGGRVVPWERK